MLGKTKGRRRRGRQRMRWLDGITDSTDMNLGKLRKLVRDTEDQHVTIHGVRELDTTWQLSNNNNSSCPGFSLRGLLLVLSTGSRVRRLQQLQCVGSGTAVQGLSCSAACGIFSDQGSNPSPAPARGIFTTEPPGKQALYF